MQKFLLLLFVSVALGAKYSIKFYYSDTQCTEGNQIRAVATREDCGTIEYGSCSTDAFGVHSRTECRGVQPLFGFTGAVQTATFPVADCQGDPDEINFYAGNTCISLGLFSYKYQCDLGANTLTTTTYSGGSCSSSGTISDTPSACENTNGGSTSNGCLAPCFHEDTQIHAGEGSSARSLKELRADGDCAVPHHYNAGVGGVRVTTSCKDAPALRVTKDHLVYTQRGLVQAGRLVVGQDYLFRDDDETDQCRVLDIAAESGSYFALNCAESQVFADGFKTSTFGGDHHQVPAAWMRWGSRIFGVHRASAWGDSIVRFLRTHKIIN